jgi:hypothetical protein
VKAFRLRRAGARPTGAITDAEKPPTGKRCCCVVAGSACNASSAGLR